MAAGIKTAVKAAVAEEAEAAIRAELADAGVEEAAGVVEAEEVDEGAVEEVVEEGRADMKVPSR